MVRVQKFSDYCVKMEGQDLEIVIRHFSRETGVSVRTVEEYWDVLSPGNKGRLFVRDGIIRVKQRRGAA